MNNRQKKKQFKKIYGMNPKQYEKWLRDNWPEVLNGKLNKSAEAIKEGFREFGKKAIEAAELIAEAIAAWGEEIRVAAGFIETEEMLRKSELLPQGREKELLKHLGIRMDRMGWAYNFYYDEQNEAYFVEVLQEGGEN